MTVDTLAGRVALVTGANHGIGAATAVALGRLGADVAVTYLRLTGRDDDPGTPALYRTQRNQHGEAVVAAVKATGVRCVGLEADLADPTVPGQLFDDAGRRSRPCVDHFCGGAARG